MTSLPGLRKRGRWPLLLVAVGIPTLLLLLAPGLVATGVRGAAGARGLEASWTRLDVGLPLRARFSGLVVVRRAQGDTLLLADSLAVSVDPWSLLRLRPRVASIGMARARGRPVPGGVADPDTIAPIRAGGRDRRDDPRRAARVRVLARSLADLLAAPARNLPRLSLRDVTIVAAPGPAGGSSDDGMPGLHLAWLQLTTGRAGARLAGRGEILGREPVPFRAALEYGRDDRISGGVRFDVPAPGGGRPDAVHITVDGWLRQDRHAGRVTIADSTRVTLGTLRFRLGGEVARAEPSFHLVLEADSLTADQWQASLPRAVLGPLLDVSIRGWYAYRVSLALDLSRPDSVGFTAEVRPHGLRLDPARTRLDLLSLDEPFVARIRLPRDRVVERDLSPANLHFRPLTGIDTLLTHSVVTNEDGAFFRHRGFNPEAVRSAIADNLRAGAFRRGAGTITMQLVRNLFLGHARTLPRKGQEVVLAWVLEHLTPLEKERMLEIYLNIIEWGPGVHGADEAAHYYFGHDAGRVTVPEALFLATVVPSPVKWHYRFDAAGDLRPFARDQMHFIGRAMVRKGWLDPDALPPAESLHVELRGPARDMLFPLPQARDIRAAADGDSSAT